MRRILFFLPLLALLLAACTGAAAETTTPQASTPASTASAGANNGGATNNGASSFERVDQQGAVTVTVTPLNLTNPGATLDFEVSLQTHSVELDMDLTSLSTLSSDVGVTISGPTWDGNSGGHHVTGKLSFPTSQDGKSLMEGAQTLTLVIKNVDAEKRTFSWDLSK